MATTTRTQQVKITTLGMKKIRVTCSPNEKNFEVLFHYPINSTDLLKVTGHPFSNKSKNDVRPFTPSTRQNDDCGHSSKLVSKSSFF